MTGHETSEARPERGRAGSCRRAPAGWPRPDVPEERARRVRGAVRVRWQEEVRARKRRSQWLLGTLLAAAVLLVALGLAVTRPRVASPTGPAPSIATVEVIAGSVSLVDPTRGTTVSAKVGDGIPARSTVSTEADGRVALRLAGGASLRADHETRLGLASAQDVLLERGAVYVDNAPAGARATLQVRTELGVLRDVGTQFEVRVGEGVLRLRVREGMVALDRDAGSEMAEAGVELTVERDGRLARRRVLAGTSDWGWTSGDRSRVRDRGAPLAGVPAVDGSRDRMAAPVRQPADRGVNWRRGAPRLRLRPCAGGGARRRAPHVRPGLSNRRRGAPRRAGGPATGRPMTRAAIIVGLAALAATTTAAGVGQRPRCTGRPLAVVLTEIGAWAGSTSCSAAWWCGPS